MLLYAAVSATLVAVVGLVVRPAMGLALLFIAKPLVDATFGQPLAARLALTHVVGTIVPLVVFGHMLFARRDEGLGRTPLRAFWLAYASDVALFSILVAYSDSLMKGSEVFLRHVNGFVGFYMVQAFIRDRKSIKLLLAALLLAGLFPMGIGAYQILTGKVWTHAQAEGLLRYVGLYHDAFTVRAYAFQTIMAALLYGELYGGRGALLRLGLLGYGAVAVAVLSRAYSKAGIVSLVIWTACWTGLRGRFVTLAAVALGVAGAGAYFASDLVADVQQLFNKEIGVLEGTVDTERSFAGRWYGWREMAARWTSFPVLAQAFGSGEVATGAHNDYLQILFHGGVLGLAIYVALLAAVGARLVTNLRAKVDPLSIAAVMLYLMWLVDTIGLVPSAYPGYQWFVWGLIGLSVRLREDEARGARVPRSTPERGTNSAGMRRGRDRVARAALGLLVLLVSASPAAGRERRAIFDEGIGWTTREGADRTLQRIKDAGFTMYVPCVWHGRGTSWPSLRAPWDTYLSGLDGRGHDPLRYLISKAHAMGIEVHPWFTVALRQAAILPEFARPGTPAQAFDVHDPDFRTFVADLVAEVVLRYDVDGVNLDYVRTMGLCVSATCRSDYERRYARSFESDRLVFREKPGRVPSMVEWQRRSVSMLVEGVSDRVRAARPGVLLSADVAPDVLSLVQGQDSLEWVDRGWVDVLFRMDYGRVIDVALTESLRSRIGRPDALALLVSNNERVAYRVGVARDGAWLAATVAMIRRRWPGAGIGVYLFGMLTDDQVEALKAGPFEAWPGSARSPTR